MSQDQELTRKKSDKRMSLSEAVGTFVNDGGFSLTSNGAIWSGEKLRSIF